MSVIIVFECEDNEVTHKISIAGRSEKPTGDEKEALRELYNIESILKRKKEELEK